MVVGLFTRNYDKRFVSSLLTNRGAPRGRPGRADPLWGLPCDIFSGFLPFNPRPAGGGAQRAPCGFSQIAPEVLGISL